MSISVYTYRDPYKLNQEPYWDEIRSCPYFCVSQTLVNGLKYLYKKDFVQGRVTTVQNLVDTIFDHWESTACAVKQHTDIDNIILSGLGTTLGSTMQDNITRAFLFNREEVFNSIRVMFELNIATVYKGNIIKNLIMDCQSYTKYRPNETTGGIFVSWRRKEELPTGA